MVANDRPFMLRVTEVFSKDSSHHAYRISSEPPYLPFKTIPTDFNYVNDHPAIYFLRREISEKEKEKVINRIKKAGIYDEVMAYRFKTNYPEWVMLYKRNTNSYKLIKGARYRDLEELIKLD